MPRLTRTQKFADLRDSLANDREPSLSTKDLSDYENKLSNITGQLPNNETVDKAPQTIKEETDPRYVWTSFQEPKTNPVDELVETIRDREFEKTLTQTSAFNSIQETWLIHHAKVCAFLDLRKLGIETCKNIIELIILPSYINVDYIITCSDKRFTLKLGAKTLHAL